MEGECESKKGSALSNNKKSNYSGPNTVKILRIGIIKKIYVCSKSMNEALQDTYVGHDIAFTFLL